MSVIDAGEPKRINIIPSRACAYVTMKDRKAAFRVMERLQRGIQVAKRNVKVSSDFLLIIFSRYDNFL